MRHAVRRLLPLTLLAVALLVLPQAAQAVPQPEGDGTVVTGQRLPACPGGRSLAERRGVERPCDGPGLR